MLEFQMFTSQKRKTKESRKTKGKKEGKQGGLREAQISIV